MTKKILHVCLASFYIDNFSYQENLLPKYHKKLGYEVEILASLVSFDKNGDTILLNNASEYYNENDILVKRIEYKKGTLSKKLRLYKDTYKKIDESNPDILFIHGCQFLDMREVVKYMKKHKNVKVFVDNHADFSNSARNWLSKNILHKNIWKHCAQIINPYTEKFYGVLPARVDFLIDIYEVPKNKVELLVMGADDDQVRKIEGKETNKSNTFDQKVITVVTGGKIDNFKKQILTLMEISNEINDPRFKLIVFGSVIEELKDEVDSLSKSEYIEYIGWVNNEESYKVIDSADLVVFPGRHSVYWEQTVGQGKPLLVKYWPGTTHIDLGGNVEFLLNDTKDEIKEKLLGIISNKEKLESMTYYAKQHHEDFLYSSISRKSIEY